MILTDTVFAITDYSGTISAGPWDQFAASNGLLIEPLVVPYWIKPDLIESQKGSGIIAVARHLITKTTDGERVVVWEAGFVGNPDIAEQERLVSELGTEYMNRMRCAEGRMVIFQHPIYIIKPSQNSTHHDTYNPPCEALFSN